jgi:hypothetical protein
MLRSYLTPQAVPATAAFGRDNRHVCGSPDKDVASGTRPARLQLIRRKGFNLHALSRDLNGRDAVFVARPGRWSNPFIVTTRFPAGSKIGINCIAVPSVEQSIVCFRAFLEENPALVAKAKAELGGYNLACWCNAGLPCHADVLLDIANR